MHTCVSLADLRALLAPMRREGRRIGFVPTMGNLHAGHYSLLAIAREHADVVVASVFVNPTQFGPNEDFARYPRTPDADAAGLAAHGCDVLFLPGVEDLYPFGAARSVKVGVPELPDVLEGAIRPGHFDGVATVVAKLFNLVQPQAAVFGRKDYQQLLVIRRMGDVLTGVIAALLAQGCDAWDAARLGVALHARAGDAAAGDAPRGLVAGDLFGPLRRLVNGTCAC